MRVYLQNQDPQWDISPGTPEFKILESVAQQLENISLDGLLSTYHFDIEKKAGAELDLFLALFGFYRQRSKRATGVVVLRRGTPAPNDISIPLGTQVFAPSINGNPSVFFSTTAPAIINTGETQVVVPIEATVGGTTGNVPAYSITSFSSSANNVTEAYNPIPTSGGSNAESDDALRERFRRTFLRSIAGTENQFAGVALAETGSVSKVNVISPVENYREQIQFYPIDNLTSATPYQIIDHTDATQKGNFPSLSEDSSFLVASFDADGLMDFHRVTVGVDNDWTFDNEPVNYTKLLVAYESSVRDAKYVFPPGSEIVGINLDTTYEVLAKPNAFDPKLNVADYTMVTNKPNTANTSIINFPVFIFSSSGVVRLGGPESVITAQFEYTPISSRNEPPNVMNKMDLYVQGKDENNIDEQVFMVQGESSIFSTDSMSSLFNEDFIREDGVTHPQADNLFTLIGRTPVVSVPSTISVNRFIGDSANLDDLTKNLDESQIYYKDEDYWFVTKTTVGGEYNVLTGTRRSLEGIEWNTPLVDAGEYVRPTGTTFNVYQSNYTGQLNGYYAYVFTWEVDGKESLPSDASALSAKVSNKQVLFHFDNVDSVFAGTGDSIYRKIYRSKAAASLEEAEQGPFYLVKVIRNNDGNVYWMDNTADDNLGFTTPPKPPPPNGAPIDLSYTYNSLIERLDNRMDLVRLVGQDIMTHQAKEVPIKFNLAVVAALNSSYNSVKAGVTSALNRFLESKSFGPDLQKADLIAAIETAAEVDNVRLLNIGEESNEVMEVQLSSPSQLTSTDTMTVTVDNYSTSSLTADEEGYIVREALEALPVFEAGDTYATYLTSAFGLTGSDNFLEDSSTLTVWNNSNAQRIVDIVDSELGDVYLQITQMGDGNLHKDEIVKVLSYSTALSVSNEASSLGYTTADVIKKFSVTSRSSTSTSVTLVTAFHGLDVGSDIKLFDSTSGTIGITVELTATGDTSVTFDRGSLTSTDINNISYFTAQIANASSIHFEVARAQLGSVKRHYGNSGSNDVLKAGSEAWIHLLGDIAVAKNASNNNKEVTYTISLLSNIFQTFTANLNNPGDPIIINNWGSRSLFNERNEYRFGVTTGGNVSSSVVRKTAGLGSGIQILAPNKRNIISTNFEDMYFDSNEVLVFGGLDLVLRARNTFNA